MKILRNFCIIPFFLGGIFILSPFYLQKACTNCAFCKHFWEILQKLCFVQKFSEILRNFRQFSKILHGFCLLRKLFGNSAYRRNFVVYFSAQILQSANYRNSAEFSHFYLKGIGYKISMNRFMYI